MQNYLTNYKKKKKYSQIKGFFNTLYDFCSGFYLKKKIIKKKIQFKTLKYHKVHYYIIKPYHR